MADDLEDVSVVETTETTPSAAETAQVSTPVVAEVEPSGEPSTPADERVFTPSTRTGSAEDYIRQQTAEENGTALGNGSVDGRTVTQAGHNAKAAAADDKKADLLEQIQQSEARRKEKEDNFGMSSHDLTKLLDFISNPELQEKLKARLVKGGMDEKRAKKALAELDEFNQLKKKQDSGQPLTNEEKIRMAELRKSEDLKVVVQAANEIKSEIELKTSGAHVNGASRIEAAGIGADASEAQKAMRVSFATVEIKGSPITETYNTASNGNKNYQKLDDMVLAQANAIKQTKVEVAGAGFTV